MKLKPISIAAVGGALLVLTGALSPTPASPQEPVSEQHATEPMSERLKAHVGTWDCRMSVWSGPGEPLVAKGTEVVRSLGTHVLADYTSVAPEMPFLGHGVTSWDPTRKVFVTVWVDSIGTAPAILEGTYDKGSNTITFRGETDMMGQRMKVRQLVAAQDEDHRTFDMFVTPPGGKEMQAMRVEYTRR